MRLALILLVWALSAEGQQSPLVEAAKSSKRAPLVTEYPAAPSLRPVRWYNSAPLSPDKLRGKVILLDFWATWCGPCIRGQPKVAELVTRFRGRGFVAILVHAPTTHQILHEEGRAPVRKELPAGDVLQQFIASRELTLSVAVAGENDFDTFGVGPIPHYVLIDRQGRIRSTTRGKVPAEHDILELLDEAPPSRQVSPN